MRKFFLILISSIFIIGSARAQYDPQFSQNMNCLSFYNPAMISIDGQARVFGLNRQQWIGLTNAPQTTIFSFSLPFKINDTRHAAGISFMNDAAGLFASQSVYLQYAYQRKIWGGTIAAGVNLGFLNSSFDGSKRYIPATGDYHRTDDQVIPSGEENGNAFDIYLGLAYSDERRYLGVSLSHIASPTLEIGEYAEAKVKPLINVTGGYNFFFSDALYVLKPSVFFKSDFAAWQVDLNAILEYKKRFFGGISYRYQDAFVFLAGAKIAGIEVCYSYDLTTSKLAKVSGGSHEVSLSYSFTLERTVSNKTKSVRIL